MSSRSFFEVHIATHQQGSSEIDYRAIHRHMVEQGFERVTQTTAQVANEVPGVYRLHNAQLSMLQVVEMIRVALTSLGRRMAVKVLKIEEESLFNFIPSAAPAQARSEPKSRKSAATASRIKAQSGYPAWRRPR